MSTATERKVEIPEIVQQVFWSVRDRFKYGLDKDSYGEIDKWVSFADVPGVFTGDCEDFAITCADILTGDPINIDPNTVYLILCRVEKNNAYHALCGVMADDKMMMLDCNATNVYWFPNKSYKNYLAWCYGGNKAEWIPMSQKVPEIVTSERAG